MPIHQYICQPTSLGGCYTAKHCPDSGSCFECFSQKICQQVYGCKSVALISRNVLKVLNDCCMGTWLPLQHCTCAIIPTNHHKRGWCGQVLWLIWKFLPFAQSEVLRCWPTHGCKSATSTSTKVLQVFINLLGTQAMPIHQYICQPTSLGGR